MPHDPTQVLMGVTQNTDRPGATSYPGDPETFKAGIACRLGSDGYLTLTKGSNQWCGISLGRSLSGPIGRTTVLPAGLRIPVALSLGRANATATITSFANLVSGTADTLAIGATTFTAQAGAATPGAATFQAATSNNATATSLATQINAHATAGALVTASANGAIVTIAAKAAGVGGNAITIVYTNGDANVGLTLGNATGGHLNGGSADNSGITYVTQGQKVYFDDATGLATESKAGSTISDATYCDSVVRTGIGEDGNTYPVAWVDVVGSL